MIVLVFELPTGLTLLLYSEDNSFCYGRAMLKEKAESKGELGCKTLVQKLAFI